ncbi:hypothetical protein [Anaerophilus nitritogenes]|uniref:hypothetical protein n=1 Tax=Anaerophilus nitritogenes TaxID=2498136 RepID=UPI00101CEE20|nr:hypothetical protein [Anaerophilus nitritogenes]
MIQDFRDPIEYVVNQYFQEKKMIGLNSDGEDSGYTLNGSFYQDDNLPDEPVYIIRDEDKRVKKVVYGNVDILLEDEEADPIIWMEELIRDNHGKVEKIKVVYPDGEELVKEIKRNENGKVEKFG